MFDTYMARPSNTYTSCNATITEVKAPTDASMKLLEEFRKEAQDSVIERGLLTIPEINADISFIKMNNLRTFSIDFKYKLTLNGKEFINTIKLNSFEEPTENEFLLKVRDDITQLLSTQLTIKLAKSQNFRY